MRSTHDDVIKWKHCSRYWSFVWWIQRSPVNSPYKGQWRGALVFSLMYAWTSGCVNNRNAGASRSKRQHVSIGLDDRSIMRPRCLNKVTLSVMMQRICWILSICWMIYSAWGMMMDKFIAHKWHAEDKSDDWHILDNDCNEILMITSCDNSIHCQRLGNAHCRWAPNYSAGLPRPVQ